MKIQNRKLVAALCIILLVTMSFGSMAAAQTGGSSANVSVPAANTQTNNVSLWGFSFWDALNSALATLVNGMLAIAAFFLSIAAGLLNVSLILTLNIKEFVDATPAIYTIWKTIRDISGIFFIFMLLWAALKIILDIGHGYQKLLIWIVGVGIVINFSFFITSVLIDASNVVSQAIYNAMIPNGASLTLDKNSSLSDIAARMTGYDRQSGTVQNTRAGISDIFMNSLKIQSLYDSRGHNVGAAVGDPLKIMMIGAVGIVIMVTAGLSFALAAAAFIARLVILIFLLAFSPIWFAAMVIPELRSQFPYWNTLKSQLIFMPVYLLLMYAALTILNESNIMGAATAMTSSMPTGSNWAFSYIVLAINFAMVIIILNLPLVVGLKMGGMASDWLGKAMNKVNTKNIWKNVGGGVSGFVGRNTLGWAGTVADKTLSNTRFGNYLPTKDLRQITTGKMAAAKYGGAKTFADVQKESKELSKKRDDIRRTNKLRSMIESRATIDEVNAVLKEMKTKDKLSAGTDILKSPVVLSRLKSEDFEAIKKSEEIKDSDKAAINEGRVRAIEDAVARNDSTTIKFMVDNMDGKDLFKIAGTPAAPGKITDPQVIEHLKPSQLRTLADEGLEQSLRQQIGNVIRSNPSFKTFGWINSPNNSSVWS